MKTYGETRPSIAAEDNTTNRNGCRKLARKRARDKKMLHRHARRTVQINPE